MKYRVEVTEPAQNDADEVYEWLRERSAGGAASWWQVFLATLVLYQKTTKLNTIPSTATASPKSVAQRVPVISG